MISKNKKTDQLHMRIDPNLKKDLEKAAAKDGRSVANALTIAISDYIKKVKENKP